MAAGAEAVTGMLAALDARLTRPAILIIDLGPQPRVRNVGQADDLYELITERADRSLILTSNRAPAKAHMFAATCAR